MADRLLKRLLHDRFLITLKTGEAFDGLLVEADERTVRLANAHVVTKMSRVAVEGDLYFSRADILYMQTSRS